MYVHEQNKIKERETRIKNKRINQGEFEAMRAKQVNVHEGCGIEVEGQEGGGRQSLLCVFLFFRCVFRCLLPE